MATIRVAVVHSMAGCRRASRSMAARCGGRGAAACPRALRRVARTRRGRSLCRRPRLTWARARARGRARTRPAARRPHRAGSGESPRGPRRTARGPPLITSTLPRSSSGSIATTWGARRESTCVQSSPTAPAPTTSVRPRGTRSTARRTHASGSTQTPSRSPSEAGSGTQCVARRYSENPPGSMRVSRNSPQVDCCPARSARRCRRGRGGRR